MREGHNEVHDELESQGGRTKSSLGIAATLFPEVRGSCDGGVCALKLRFRRCWTNTTIIAFVGGFFWWW